MVAPSGGDARRARVGRQVILGVLVGIVAFYVASVASSAWYRSVGIPPWGISVTLWYLPMLVIAGGSVFLGWRWPTVGLAAGIFVLALVAFALATQISMIELPLRSWLDLGSVFAHGIGNVFVPVVGMVLVCSSITGRRSSRN